MHYDFIKSWRLLRIQRKDFLAVYKSNPAKCRDEFLEIMDVFCVEYNISYKFDETEMLCLVEALLIGPSHSRCYIEFLPVPVCGEMGDNPFTYIGHGLNISVKSGRSDTKTLYSYTVPFNERT